MLVGRLTTRCSGRLTIKCTRPTVVQALGSAAMRRRCGAPPLNGDVSRHGLALCQFRKSVRLTTQFLGDKLVASKRKRTTPHHADGTICLEGTSRVPKPYRPCCQAFDVQTSMCAFDVRYEWSPRQKTWVIAISESAGGGGVVITYCPHCGDKLRPSGGARSER